MNYLLASDSNVERAGVCIFMLDWIRGIRNIDKNGTIIVYFRKGILSKEIASMYSELDAKIVCGNLPQNASNLSLENRRIIKKDIKGLFHSYKFDVIHVNSSAMGFSSMLLSEAKKEHIPVRIAHSHGRNLGNGWKNIYLWFLRMKIYLNATKYAGCSVDAGEYLFGKKVLSSKRWYFIPNTVSVEKYKFNLSKREEYRNKLKVDRDTILLGATGMLDSRKNHIFLVPLIKRLKDRNISVKLVVLGEGNQRNEIEELCRKLHIEEYVCLLGTSNCVSEWLSAMDVYVMPSKTEGLPIGAVEAQANGLYCIMSNGVPRDVDISDRVFHLSINNGVDEWADLICNLPSMDEKERLEGQTILKEAGFDSSSITKYISNLYGV